jgi:SAM-dependent methyltransferase
MDDAGSSFLNYGYAPLDPPYQDVELPPELEPDRYGMQLYNRVASGAELAGKDVLEVGCGRGGGASFVFDRFKPSSMVGLDLAEKAVAHCNHVHGRSGLEFRAGDAEALPFPDASFDAVLNVESSHCYPNIDRFFGEVFRVLRPGGHLLFADLRGEDPTGETPSPRDELRNQLKEAGFEIVEEEDITRNVVRSLDLDSDRRKASVQKYTPKVLQPQMLDFAGIIGSKTYDNFDSGRATYTRFVARKTESVPAAV